MLERERGEEYAVYWPRGRRHVPLQPLAQRPATLDGKTVACLWNFLFKGDYIFSLLKEQLTAQFPGVRFVDWSEFGNTHGTGERKSLAALARRFQELGVDAAISGMGC
jgi:hypothetical protein